MSNEQPLDPDSVPEAIARLSDREWLDVLRHSLTDPGHAGLSLPGFPTAAVQERFVGSSGERTLDEAFAFYRLVKDAATQLGTPLAEESAVLDFGCGWGRITRFFLHDVAARNLVGIDAMPTAVELCGEIGAPWTVVLGPLVPPTTLEPESFDLVYAYSVFSHLAPATADAWIEELGRVLRPGGILVLTTRGPFFLDYIEQRVRKAGDDASDALVAAYSDIDSIRSRYEAGEFVYLPTGGGETLTSDHYGEALVPERYVRARWTTAFELSHFVARPKQLPQAVAVLRRRGGAAVTRRRRRLRLRLRS